MVSTLLDHPLICNHCGKEINNDYMIVSNKKCPNGHNMYLFVTIQYQKTMYKFRCPYNQEGCNNERNPN